MCIRDRFFIDLEVAAFYTVGWSARLYGDFHPITTILTGKTQACNRLGSYLKFMRLRERKRDRENQFQRPVAPSEARALELF